MLLRAAEFPRHLPFVEFLTALVLRGFSPFIHPMLIRSSLSEQVRYAEASSTICVTESVRLLRLSRASAEKIELRGMAVVPCPFVFY